MGAYLSEFILIADFHKRIEDIKLQSGKVGVQVVFFYETGYYDAGGSWKSRQHHLTVKAWGRAGEQLATLYGPGDKLLLQCEVGSREYNERYYAEITAKVVTPFDAKLRKISGKMEDTQPTEPTTPSRSQTVTTKEDDSDLPF